MGRRKAREGLCTMLQCPGSGGFSLGAVRSLLGTLSTRSQIGLFALTSQLAELISNFGLFMKPSMFGKAKCGAAYGRRMPSLMALIRGL